MKTTLINMHDAKTHLSEYARRVRKGERFILCDRNKPFADFRPLCTDEGGKRPFGLARGLIHVPDDFNDPDPEIEALFSGNS
jgi:antitoxin (DNA-binding transcriptional repressor) of toxin-antitoxin stability system